VGFWYRFHLATCPHCRACRRQLDEAVALSKEIPAEHVSDKVMDAALAAFRERRKL
jgi:anti-sigma factor RsiW